MKQTQVQKPPVQIDPTPVQMEPTPVQMKPKMNQTTCSCGNRILYPKDRNLDHRCFGGTAATGGGCTPICTLCNLPLGSFTKENRQIVDTLNRVVIRLVENGVIEYTPLV
jgi:hypothetical protein